ncbi:MULTISPECIES: (2Fe-2S)-binding protein [Paracoccus]|uniref:(2Fe-2S)-binding protein n=1 Tax=Paracoccus fontiphilus TaxID=1815556 RepID=A0ABV7ILI6_9RHOB|nr:(2Fe-2S)-binding protein [Paracoccus fontiphilus]
MNAASRFRDAPDAIPRTIRMTFDGEQVLARPGESVAAALLAQDGGATRITPITGAGRTPFCMMGVCFDCLVTIDGRYNIQACMTPASDGMVIHRQTGARRIGDVR